MTTINVPEACEGCGRVGVALEFQNGDEPTYNAAGLSTGPRWYAPPAGWLTSFDGGGEHWVCCIQCARKVDSVERARQVRQAQEGTTHAT